MVQHGFSAALERRALGARSSWMHNHMFSVCHPSVRVAVTMNVESIEACTDVHVAAHLLLALGLSLR
jgi:hypothetical protein